MGKYLFLGGSALLLLFAIFAVYVRLSPMNVVRWHVDPVGIERTGRPNDYLLSSGGNDPALRLPLTPPEAAERLLARALAEPRTTLLAGGAGGGWFTYVARSARMSFPDVVTVRAVPTVGGSEVHIYARARYGYSDMGVNAARVGRLIEGLQ